MAFHVPFSQRPSGRHQSQPVYIGFEPPRRKRREFNWWGFNGIFLFFLSLGVLSPISLLISLVGLRKQPRRMAVVGTGLSLIGTAVIATILISIVHQANMKQQRREMARQRFATARQVEEGQSLLSYAASEFEQYRDDNDGNLPTDLDGSMLALKHVDPWENELMYEVDGQSVALRSAGPDRDFFTKDDLTYQIAGQAKSEALLPIEKGEVVD